MKGYEHLNKLAFDVWMQEEHRKFYFITGIIGFILALSFVTSIVLVFFVDWWWKMSLITILSTLICRVCVRFAIQEFIIKFLRDKNK